MPQLSIITINLNNKDGLEKTVRSVIGQTYIDLEYIVIDGNSTDGSVNVIEKYSDKITQWISESDSGIYEAMNKGIAKANGQYLLFLNSGDYLYTPDVLEKIFSFRHSEDIIYGDMMIDRGTGKLEYGHSPDPLTFEEMIGSTLWHPVSFIRKGLFDKYGVYNTELKIVADYEFFLKVIFMHNATINHVSLPVSVFKTDGIGSVEKYDSLHKQEKLAVQFNYFSPFVINSVNRFNDLKRSNPVLVANWLIKKPLLYKGVFILYKLLNYFRS
jgi:glycosyltransferase involved in cell wall biosynthesis